MTDTPEVSQTADQKQAGQAKKLTDDERKAADKAAAVSRKTAQEKEHAERLKLGIEQNKANADNLYLGRRAVKIVRKAAPDDIGFSETEASSVVVYKDSGVEVVVLDKDIQTSPAA